jgi:hypothetical protein
MFNNYKQSQQKYVDAIEMTNDNVKLIVGKLKEKNIVHSLYTKDLGDSIHNTIFIKENSCEYRLGYGMMLVVYEKGGVLVMTKDDFNQRFDTVSSPESKSMTPEEQQALWPGSYTWRK